MNTFVYVILSEAKNLHEVVRLLERFFASLRMTWEIVTLIVKHAPFPTCRGFSTSQQADDCQSS